MGDRTENQNWKTVAFAVSSLTGLVLMTALGLLLGAVANATTVGFGYLVIVVLAAIFAGLGVAMITSIVATLLFNYFFFAPIGTFIIADPANWVALFAFLFTSIVISRLTASAHENAGKVSVLKKSNEALNAFGGWLLSQPPEMITLSAIAKAAVRIFSLEYCSIHVYTVGRWHQFTGTALGELPQMVAEKLKIAADHPTELMELIEEQSLGVRYCQIRLEDKFFALLAIKSDFLPMQAIETMGALIGMVLKTEKV